MKRVIKNLISISEALSALSVKVEKIAAVFEKETVQAKPAKKTAAKKKAVSKAVKKKAAPKKKVAAKKKKVPKKAEPKVEASESGNILDNVYELISSGGKGTTVSELKKKGGFTPRQVNNALYKLKQSGKIESLSRGVYLRNKS